MTTPRRAIGHLDIDRCAAVYTGRSTAEEVEAVARLVDARAHDAPDRAELLDALGLTNTRKTKGDR